MSKRVLIPFRHRAKLKPYVEAVAAGGMEPIVMDVECPQELDGVEGLLLMGGTDVNPRRYHSDAHSKTDSPDDVRDDVELDLIDQALQKNVPMLAICRGLQILNVYHGGTLVQHLPSHPRHDIAAEKRGAAAHSVVIEPQSLLAEIAGTATWPVNSRHHQAADRIGEGLSVVARDPEDGVIEALERKDKRFVLAVQWHPEDQVHEFPEQLGLFRRFAQAI